MLAGQPRLSSDTSESLILAPALFQGAAQLSQTNPAHDLLDDIQTYLQVFW